MQEVLGIALAVSNVCWLVLTLKMLQNQLEMSKLLASRTLSEYQWLKTAEGPRKEAAEAPEEGYETIWEKEE